jgi:SAM-dependent methyltransferase
MTALESTREDRTPSDRHTEVNRRYWDEQAAAAHGPLARAQWAKAEPQWGLWATPESSVGVLPGDLTGMRTIELGCGTGYVSAWLARAGARPFGIDLSGRQLGTARAMQAEFSIDFPLVLGAAEQLPCRDASFDLAISEYGASLWCDPHRWVPEAARHDRAGGVRVMWRGTPGARPVSGSAQCSLAPGMRPSRRASVSRAVNVARSLSWGYGSLGTGTPRKSQSGSQPWPTS